MVTPLSPAFLVIYVAAASTDVLDGYVARKLATESAYGYYFDSAADVVLMVTVIYCLLTCLRIDLWIWAWLLAIAAVRVSAFVIGSYRFRRPAFLHSYLNKVTGAILFLTPIILVILDVPATAFLLGTVATVGSVEYLYVNLTNATFEPNYGSIFLRYKSEK